MFEVGLTSRMNEVWCWPSAWFARGMAGSAWLPMQAAAHTLYRVELNSRQAMAIAFPDAFADCALSSNRILVSCWNGAAYLLDDAGKPLASHDIGDPARVAWNYDGSFAVAGTAGGRLFRVEEKGKSAGAARSR
jgi:hypothetical protein